MTQNGKEKESKGRNHAVIRWKGYHKVNNAARTQNNKDGTE